MPTWRGPTYDLLDGLTTAIIVDQERMGANPRSTVGTATDANAMLRVLFSRFGTAAHRLAQGVLVQRPVGARRRRGHDPSKAGGPEARSASFTIIGGMCPRCEGMGSVTDIDLTAALRRDKSLARAPSPIPGYSMDGWYGRIFPAAASSTRTSRSATTRKRELARPAAPRSPPRSRWRASTSPTRA
jgi:excinuclease UvrABC ATPase subunit